MITISYSGARDLNEIAVTEAKHVLQLHTIIQCAAAQIRSWHQSGMAGVAHGLTTESFLLRERQKFAVCSHRAPKDADVAAVRACAYQGALESVGWNRWC